jgi:hypothetical protein
MKMEVGIERGAEAMDEGHRPEADLRGCTWAAGLESVLDRFEEGPQHWPDEHRIMLEEKAQALPHPREPGL